MGVCRREWLQRGELITWGEGSRLAPGVDVPYLRDRFQARSPAPGLGTREEQIFFPDQLAVIGEERAGRQVFLLLALSLSITWVGCRVQGSGAYFPCYGLKCVPFPPKKIFLYVEA